MMRRLFFTAATVDAATLHHFGSVHEVVPRAELDEAALRVARDIAAKDTRVIRAAKEALNLIDVQRVNSSYRMEQGFTFELNLAGVADEHRDAFAGTAKRTTLDEAVSAIESGMTIGIGGWGSRRKPMAYVRALLRTAVKDLTVVTYGGPDVGLLCSAGKVKRVYYGFVSLDSPPFYDPWFAKVRTSGAIEAREMDEGMLRCGLQAAAQRLPFLPIRAGLGSSVLDFWEGELQTVTSPYPAPDGGYETLIAMPALRLDAAFAHLNLGDCQGNAAYTGIDPYFDDLFLMAAEKRYLSVERVVSTQELIKAVPPQALLVNRMMVDGVVEAPNGAHFTTAAPDYGRDEKFQRHYAEAASTEEGWQQFVTTYLSGNEAEYQAAVRAFAEEASK
jgi:acyl CoA:acetate/3-ketoacid CoA transferase alpha subunit